MPQMTRLTSKGQMVVPKRLREVQGIRVGDSLTIESEGENVRVTRRSGWARATAGTLPSPHGQIEPEELEELLEHTKHSETIEAYGDET